ncbi:MAG: NADH-quinone oxidoreductase subunit NuoH [Gemmatimonadetes bacterium]|nr:NADH-quinone oxidoreductase subunit NuoH [Gemmatimonadota bacterium]
MTPEMKGFLLLAVLKMVVVFTVVMVGVALLTLMERKVSAWMQNRRGPNRVGFAGLLQPAADGVKNIVKEETYPAEANSFLFILAPALAFIPAMCLSAVIPWAAPVDISLDRTLPLLGHVRYDGRMAMAVADLPIGFLFVLAVSSLGVYGIALAGWSSNSKYSLLGGLRSSAQMISYEVAMGMSLIPLLILVGNASFGDVIKAQQDGLWFILPLTLSFFVFLVAGFAETNRLPFDLPEAESELIAGYHTEYSAMKFSLFFIAEYANMVTVSAMLATLFFGGWDIPGTSWDQNGSTLAAVATGAAMFLKTFFFLFFFMWIRWTLPRFRYDQLMALGWKFLIPLALVYLMIIAVAVWILEAVVGIADPKIKALILFGMNAVMCYVVFFILDRGTLVSGSYRRQVPANVGS